MRNDIKILKKQLENITEEMSDLKKKMDNKNNSGLQGVNIYEINNIKQNISSLDNNIN